VGSEGISLLENIGMMGVKYPAFLESALEALKDKGNSGTDRGK
jgi:phage-related holin